MPSRRYKKIKVEPKVLNEKYIETHSFSKMHEEACTQKHIKNNPQAIERRIKLQLKKLFSIYGSDIAKLFKEKSIQNLIIKLTPREKLFFYDTILKSHNIKEHHRESYDNWHKKISQILDSNVNLKHRTEKLNPLKELFKESPEKAISKLKQLVSNKYAKTEHIKKLQKLDKELFLDLNKKNEFYVLEMIYLFGIDHEIVSAITKTFNKHRSTL